MNNIIHKYLNNQLLWILNKYFFLPDEASFLILFNKFKALIVVLSNKLGNGDSYDSLHECINSYIEQVPNSISRNV